MSSTLGKNLEISIFGESHGSSVGVVISGLPSGEFVDTELIRSCFSISLSCTKWYFPKDFTFSNVPSSLNPVYMTSLYYLKFS